MVNSREIPCKEANIFIYISQRNANEDVLQLLTSGKLSRHYGKSPCWMDKSTIYKWSFSIVTLIYQRVISRGFITRWGIPSGNRTSQWKMDHLSVIFLYENFHSKGFFFHCHVGLPEGITWYSLSDELSPWESTLSGVEDCRFSLACDILRQWLPSGNQRWQWKIHYLQIHL